jgi:hypothetical protein
VKALAELPPPRSPSKGASPIRSSYAPPPAAPAGGGTPVGAPPETASLSSRVAAKLLEGFTLLSESCPVTSVPLVQDPSGRILSVGTGRWYERTGGALVEAGPPSSVAALPAAYDGGGAHATPSPAYPPSGPITYQLGGSLHATPHASGRPSYTPASPYGATSANSAVAAALLSAVPMGAGAPAAAVGSGTPSMPPPAFPSAAHRAVGASGGGASFLGAAPKLAVSEAIAVLSSRLSEATSAVADCPLADAGPRVALVKDIALAISALRAL